MCGLSRYSSVPDDLDREHPVGSSLTIPDQSVSLKTILQQSVNGIPFPESSKGVYESEVGYSVPDVVDLTDLQRRRDELEAELSEVLDSEKLDSFLSFVDDFVPKSEGQTNENTHNDELSPN